MKNRRRRTRLWTAPFAGWATPLVTLAALGCAGETSNPFAPATETRTTAAIVRATVHVGVAVPVFVQADPDAVCRLQIGDAPDPSRDLTLFADGRGVVSFDTTIAGPGPVVRQALDCGGPGGTRVDHPIELRTVGDGEPLASDTGYLRDLPATGTAIPALDRATAMSLDAEELLRRGYPMRPDPKAGPARLARWLEDVSAPSTLVTDRIVEEPERLNGTPTQETNPGWSGFVVDQFTAYPRRIWAQVFAYWTVPAVTAPTNVTRSYFSSTWVGLGGFTSQALPQIGTDQDISCDATRRVCNASYRAWIEYFPSPQQTLTGFAVHPGDRVAAGLYMVDANGNFTRFGTSAKFSITNYGVMPNVSVVKTLALPAGSTFVGESAEWIMERPRILQSTANLPRYANFDMTNAFGYVLDGGDPTQAHFGFQVSYDDTRASTFQMTMTNGSSATLATVLPGPEMDPGEQLTFHWVNYF